MNVHKLPPLNALRMFEAVARLGGVRTAANELCVTPPAVSHQLAKLEEYLGSPLFIRRGRSMVLTDVAQDYLKEIKPSLEAIGRATTVASQKKSRDTLTLAAPPSLTKMWLLPRLPDFMEQFPDYDVRLLDRMTFDPDERGVDLAIEYRFEPDPDLVTQQILPDELVVLTTHEFAKKHNLGSLEDLKGLTLIETERRLTSWKTILSEFPWSRRQRYLSVSYSIHAFEAAACGIGVALGNKANAERMIAQGQLCVPFELDNDTLPPVPQYYLSTLAHKERLQKVRDFWGWLEDQADQSRSQS